MARLLLRTKAFIASSGIGLGASFGPVTPPWPTKPWHCQQPCCTKAFLPFSALPAAAAGFAAKAARAAAVNRKRIALSLARLRPHVEKGGLAGLHDLHRFPERRSELRGVLDRALRPPAHRFGELVVLDVGVLNAGADRSHVAAEVRGAVAEVGEALHVHHFLAVAADVGHAGEERDLVLRGRP